MVVYTELHKSGKAKYNEYWKLSIPRKYATNPFMRRLLAQSHYYVPTSAKKVSLMRAVDRCDAGHPSYHRCRVAELKHFCVQSKLLPPSSTVQTIKRDRLVEILEKADEDATFIQFMDLPPELRAHVLSLYFESFPALMNPAQPPISKVSRVMRQESLPIFYFTCSIRLEMISYTRDTEQGKFINENFLDSIPDEHLKMMRHLSIRDVSNHRAGILKWNEGTISFSCRGIGFSEHIEPGSKLRHLVDHLLGRPHGKGLTRADVHEIKAVIEANRKEAEGDDE